jgi:hypothetical protein
MMILASRRNSARLMWTLAMVSGTVASIGGMPALQAAQPAAPAGSKAAPAEPQQTNEQLLRDFIHFALIDRADVANAYGRQLLDRGMKDADFVDLVERGNEGARFDEVIGRALRKPELEATAGLLLKKFEAGKLERVRNADEITKNIKLLTQGARARLIGRERLAAAGEYAMPQLLESLLQIKDLPLRSEVAALMRDMGRQSVAPLSTALPLLQPEQQELVANVLGEIPYKTSVPVLADVAKSSTSQNVRDACERAIRTLDASALSVDAATLYRELGQAYYGERPEVTSFPGEEQQLLWSYDPRSGLGMTNIRTPVFHEAMAMRAAERSLSIRSEGNGPALSLWLASNFSREIDTERLVSELKLDKGYDNPAYAPNRRDAMYYAVAAGAPVMQDVLALALDTKDTPLARRSIAAIEKTAGGAALWSSRGDRRALLEALNYPNRRVQYESALALAKAQPTATFQGSERVVPLLAGAIRNAGTRYAVILGTQDDESYKAIRQAIADSGYEVLPFATNLSSLAAEIATRPGIDLVVTNGLGAAATEELIEETRRSPALLATPVLALTSAQAYIDLGRKYDRDVAVAVRPAGLPAVTVKNAAEQLVEAAVGGRITTEEAKAYSARALSALRDLALSGNQVFSVADAMRPLIASLGEAEGETRVQVAEVLSRIGERAAQVALADTSLTTKDADRLAMLDKLGESAKRFGNQLEPRQVQRLLELAATGGNEEATAAAAVLGALNLPNDNLVPLILGNVSPTGQETP